MFTQFFGFIAMPMGHVMTVMADYLHSAGWAIILFTIGVKLVLMPLTLQQLKSARAMQQLQPHIKALQTKHKGDKQKLSEETMALYKEHKVNPAAGCLPMLVQLPILYGLYGALFDLGNPQNPLYNPLFAQPFLWLQGLSLPDQLHILPVLCVVTQWVQQRMMMTNQKNQDSQQAAMQSVMQFMPLMIGFIAWRLQAGLPLYWAVSNMFSIGQQYFITGWGSLMERPSFAGLSGLLAAPDPNRAGQNGASRNGTTKNGASGRAATRVTPKAEQDGGAAAKPRKGPTGNRPGGGKRPEDGKH
ncbi:MAG: YidC/Oxa1 family membrane protein insertase [Chloroflexota bacterium]